MKLISSWLKFNRTLGAAVATTAIFCALLAFGKAPRTGTSGPMPAKSIATKSKLTIAPKLGSGASLVPPFVGDHTETWEEFPGGDLGSPDPILNGFGTISG